MMHTGTAMKPKITSSRESDWRRLEAELLLWGKKLDELRAQSDQVGESLIKELQNHYEVLKQETEGLKQKTDTELRQAREEMERIGAEAEEHSKSILDAARANAREGANSVREMSRDIKQATGETTKAMSESAQHLGTGFSRAWRELRRSFQQAYTNLN